LLKNALTLEKIDFAFIFVLVYGDQPMQLSPNLGNRNLDEPIVES
jgi:hypothetical protein